MLTRTPAWQALHTHHAAISKTKLCDLFQKDEQRFNKFSLLFNDILLDYSKHPVTDETVTLLLKLAQQQDLEGWIKRLIRGERVNNTEHRAALHSALRGDDPIFFDGKDVLPDVKNVLQQMTDFTNRIHNGDLKGYSGKPFRDIVNIGIGGSDLGPLMVTEALKPYNKTGLNTHFISNLDGAQLSETLKNLNPETTLFIIASKTFTSQETMLNARSAREWFVANGGTETAVAGHFVAISTNVQAVEKFGISAKNMFLFWDWVGGRYSLWSAIGLSIALCVGMENFKQLLTGAKEMDQHFSNAPLAHNLPVMLGLIGIWQINFFDVKTHVILPYDQSLHRLPAYLQQLEMESNGKCVTRDGERIDYSTSPVIWGEQGVNGQHAFYQLFHQGTQRISADFLASCQSHYSIADHHRWLLANFFAQTEAMMNGRHSTENEKEALPPYKVIPGNHATTSILFKKLDPKTLGSLIALYEHKVFVQSVIWNINPFDQWGVELGKQLAEKIEKELKNDESTSSHDSSTNGLMDYFKANRGD